MAPECPSLLQFLSSRHDDIHISFNIYIYISAGIPRPPEIFWVFSLSLLLLSLTTIPLIVMFSATMLFLHHHPYEPFTIRTKIGRIVVVIILFAFHFTRLVLLYVRSVVVVIAGHGRRFNFSFRTCVTLSRLLIHFGCKGDESIEVWWKANFEIIFPLRFIVVHLVYTGGRKQGEKRDWILVFFFFRIRFCVGVSCESFFSSAIRKRIKDVFRLQKLLKTNTNWREEKGGLHSKYKQSQQ